METGATPISGNIPDTGKTYLRLQQFPDSPQSDELGHPFLVEGNSNCSSCLRSRWKKCCTNAGPCSTPLLRKLAPLRQLTIEKGLLGIIFGIFEPDPEGIFFKYPLVI